MFEDSSPLVRKWLFVVHGILVPLICITVCVMFLPQIYVRYISRPERPRPGPVVGQKAKEATDQGLSIQDVHVMAPRLVKRSNTWLMQIQQRDLSQPRRIGSRVMNFSSGRTIAYVGPPEFKGLRGGSTVNLIFFQDGDDEGRLLFDRKVLVKGLYLEIDPDDPQDYFLYTVVENDSDGDSRLTGEDLTSLWMTDDTGQGLRRVTPEHHDVVTFSYSDDKRRVFVVVREVADGVPTEHQDQKLYVYSVDNGQFRPMEAGNTPIQRAREVIQ